MGNHPKLALLRQVVKEYGNEIALFDYLTHSGKIGKKNLSFLRNINAIVTTEFFGILRDGGEPYVSHLHGVCAIGVVYCGVYDPERLAAALLHDIIEQFPERWSEKRIAAYSTERTAHLVSVCSVDRNLYYYTDEEDRKRLYYGCIAEEIESSALKLWDRSHNQLTLAACKKEKQIKKNQETKRLILPIARRHSILVEELEATIEENDNRIRALIATP